MNTNHKRRFRWCWHYSRWMPASRVGKLVSPMVAAAIPRYHLGGVDGMPDYHVPRIIEGESHDPNK